MPRTIFAEEHRQFAESVDRFIEVEVAPHYRRFEDQGYIDREVWLKAGEAGFLCSSMPEEYGGAAADALYSVVLFEQPARRAVQNLLGWALHSDIVAPYLLRYGSEAVRQHYLPRMATGEMIAAIAMTEPGAGSDLQAVRTTALRQGDHYLVNGSKTFITNGWHCDLVVVVAKTDPAKGAKGISLLVVDTTMAGFSKGNRLEKIGLKAQDTCELFFDDVRVPFDHLLGEENRGFACLMTELPWERLQIAITAVAQMEAALEWTCRHCRERKAFGSELIGFQNTRFTLAEAMTEVQIARVFVDRCIELHMAGALDASAASMAKYWCTDLQSKVLDACLQLHGGYGYMWESPIARAWADSRVARIYGGSNEIMKELIARQLP
ncbi:acyl-CoA dehydrogenase family protein [Accumulibacter sp.]|uniref:acyl-CoA dehydrogenase family protein n=1 Tax=Accumulibacter sp. TaxID=2053492 RepID=UPI0025D1FB6A|nr:acyl-CoA dehydrogenase family protein [Accumulibacter sp.]MCM8595907.1 acyl-CoA dehydrogenase family protein [Accumulibacter sp.]MDS4050056.1 acyl-CoA dehydrogenase family protein [Accumulibacter sp.]